MRNKTLFVIVSLLMVSLLAACGQGLGAAALSPLSGVSAQTTPQAPEVGTAPIRTINVAGTGQVEIAPDIANINIGVHTEAEDAATALANNNEQAQAVIAALRAAGVAAEDIQTSQFNIYPSQEYSPEGRVIATRYVVDNTVFVTVRDLANLGSLLDVVVSSGANTVNGITFDLADRTAAMSEARERAVANARVLAEELAEAAGVELGEIQSITAGVSTPPVPVFGRGGMDSAAAEVPIATGQLTVSADVTIVFQIQ